MVKKVIIGLIGITLPVIGVFVALDFLESEEARIRERFSRAASIVSKEGEEKPIAMLGLTRSLKTLFADPCTIDAPRRSISGRFSPQELASLVARGRQSFTDLSLTFHDLDITLRDKTTADTVFTALLRGSKGGQNFREVREMEATLIRKDGEWLFSNIEVVEVLRK